MAIPLSKSKGPKLSTTPSKINVKTGKGVPGDFSGASIKKPSLETEKYSNAISSVSEQQSQISESATDTTSAVAVAPAKAKLAKLSAGYKKKLSDTKTSAVDFTRPAAISRRPSDIPVNVPKVALPPLPNPPSGTNLPKG